MLITSAVLFIATEDDFDKAISDFGIVLKKQPDNAKAYNDRGFVYRLTHDFDKAIADLNKAIEIDSDFADAYTTVDLPTITKKILTGASTILAH